jgi:hypothetical protein
MIPGVTACFDEKLEEDRQYMLGIRIRKLVADYALLFFVGQSRQAVYVVAEGFYLGPSRS